jgi:2-polyprenyl-3-methyl-5-hydroxy-6-metoxy-1,4-benzoquinol methylase
MSILWNRLRYVLSPQFDIYEQIAGCVAGEVIDVGCGTGFGTHLLLRGANAVRAYEVDSETLKFAERVFSNGKMSFHYGNILKGIPDKADFVIMIDVIEHIEQDQKALEAVKEMLKPNGVFICSTPNRLSRYRKSDNHIREYSPIELRELLEKVFSKVSIRDYRLEETDSTYVNPIVGYCK